MLRFRNAGTDITTQFQILAAVYSRFGDQAFSLADFADAAAGAKLLSAYGYTGDAALGLSDVEDTSRNSTSMNMKMYGEVFRQLGWLAAYDEKEGKTKGKRANPLIVTELGKYAISSVENRELFYEQCLLGICNPQRIIDKARPTEKVRFFVCELRTLRELGGIMYKHELCMGPMSVDDLDQAAFSEMIQRIKRGRSSYDTFLDNWEQFISELGMTNQSVDNQTRFPVAGPRNVGWTRDYSSKAILPPKSLKCIQLTEKGEAALRFAESCKDLRLEEFDTYDEQTQDALIRVGFYSLLNRAGFDIKTISDEYERDKKLISHITSGRELLFSPFQVLKWRRVHKALGLSVVERELVHSTETTASERDNRAGVVALLPHAVPVDAKRTADPVAEEITEFIEQHNADGASVEEIAKALFDREEHSNEDTFYPLIGTLFGMLGFDCHVSRRGDNGSRMDAIITGPGDAIPIEIKSPGEEQYISVKAVRQAAENKVILLSRKTYATTPDATTLVVGYHAPNERAEVLDLIEAFGQVFNITIGVIPFNVLTRLVVRNVLNNENIEASQLRLLKGIADVAD